MKYDELSHPVHSLLEQAGFISDPLKVDLENMMIDCDSENHFLNSMLDYIEIIQDDPLEYLNNADFDTSVQVSSFKRSINEFHKAIIQVMSIPFSDRNKNQS